MANTHTGYGPVRPRVDPSWWATGTVDGRPMPDVLRTRDVGAVFRFLAARGWSRYAIGAACGLSENRVRAVISGQQQITSYDVLVRVADGLGIEHGLMGVAYAPVSTGPDDDAVMLIEPNIGEVLPDQSGPDVEEALSHLRQQWHVLVQADNLFGPRHALSGVEAQVELLRALLVTANRDMRGSLIDLAARFAESAAWLNQDLVHSAAAQNWTGQALEWAHQRGDLAMVAWSIYRRSQQQLEAGRPRDALDLAQAALSYDQHLGRPARAAIRVQQAHAMAAVGDPSALRVIDQAHQWADHDTLGDAANGHGSFCTPAYVEAHRATCLRLINRPNEAICAFEQSLSAIPPVYRRDTAGTLAGKSAAHVAANEPELAATTALAALPVARSTGSQRIIGRIASVATSLRPHAKLEPVAMLLDELALAA